MARRYTDRRKLERNRRLLEFDRADRPAAPFVRFHLGWPLLDLGDPAAALAACRAGQSVAPRDAELACLEAEGRLATGNPVGAAARFGAFLAGGWDNDPRAFADGVCGDRTRHGLAVALPAGRAVEQEELWRAAVAERPEFGPAWLGLGEL
ncbi:hypothetical protein J0H58_33270 [bacterium]|nr:hypothetical protein [bacterium]